MFEINDPMENVEERQLENVKRRIAKVKELTEAIHGSDEIRKEIVISQILGLAKKNDPTRCYSNLFIDLTPYTPVPTPLPYGEGNEDFVTFVRRDRRYGLDRLRDVNQKPNESISNRDELPELKFHKDLYENPLFIISDFNYPLTDRFEYIIVPQVSETGMLERAVILKRPRTVRDKDLELHSQMGVAIRNGFLQSDLSETQELRIEKSSLTNS